jgi:arabinofuranosyltransferase
VDTPATDNEKAATTASAIAAVLFLAIVTRFGWLSDDAFISFHTVDNFITGHGLVSNVGERVQGFTNPLWTLLLAAPLRLSGDIYSSAMLLSLLCCLALVVTVWRLHRGGWPTVWILLLLSTSFAFVSFSTSGLENALAHLLLALFFVTAVKEPVSLTRLWLLGALVILNRMDHALLVLPTLVLSLVRSRPLPWRSVALGLAPLIAWLVFSLVYYGFAYPNTAYAKLNVAIGRDMLLAQGLTYLVDSLLTDLLVLPTILLAIVVAIWARPRSRTSLALAGGIACYVLYVCWVGGDFMSGRFLTAPFLLAVLLLSTSVQLHPRAALALAVIALFAGQRLLLPVPVDVGTHCPVPPSGIVDERACYVEHTGIAQNLRAKKFKRHPYFLEGLKLQSGQRRVAVSSLVGMGGFAAGPNVHLIDPYALTDPLLARIRYRPAGDWRPGHLMRPLPEGYALSIERGENQLQDPCLRAMLDDLRLITRGPIFSAARWKAILRRNLTARTCAQPG